MKLLLQWCFICYGVQNVIFVCGDLFFASMVVVLVVMVMMVVRHYLQYIVWCDGCFNAVGDWEHCYVSNAIALLSQISGSL